MSFDAHDQYFGEKRKKRRQKKLKQMKLSGKNGKKGNNHKCSLESDE